MRVWGADHPYNSPAYFQWLFGANPAGQGTGSILRRGDAMIGFCGLSARRMRIAGQTILAAHCVDYMVDPATKGGMAGIYGFRLMQQWLKIAVQGGYRYGIGFPNVNSARLVTSPKLGWQTAFGTRLLIRPFARLALPSHPVRTLPPAVTAAGLATLAGWSAVSRLARSKRAAGRAVTLTAFDRLFEGLAAGPDDREDGTCLDAAYLNWRFADHPLNRYDVVAWESAGSLAGYAVTIVRDVFGFKATLLVDLAAAPGRPAVTHALLGETLRRSRDAGASMVATLAVEGSQSYRNFVRSGFVPVPAGLDPKPFLMTTHGLGVSTAAEPAHASNWRFNWADMDVV